MDVRTPLTTVGAGITSFILVAVLVIELLETEFSALVGLPVGLLVGVVVSVGLWTRGDGLRPSVRRAATAYAMFGITALLLVALRYVNIGRDVLTFEVIGGGSLATVVVTYVGLFLYDRSRS